MKKLLVSLSLLGLILIPSVTVAASLTTDQIVAILRAAGVSEQVVNIIKVALTQDPVTPPPTSDCYQFTKNLTRGSSGADVTALQKLLISKGFLNEGAATGYYGILTQSAVSKYQQAAGISPASGNVEPITRAALNNCGGVIISDPDPDSLTTPYISSIIQIGDTIKIYGDRFNSSVTVKVGDKTFTASSQPYTCPTLVAGPNPCLQRGIITFSQSAQGISNSSQQVMVSDTKGNSNQFWFNFGGVTQTVGSLSNVKILSGLTNNQATQSTNLNISWTTTEKNNIDKVDVLVCTVNQTFAAGDSNDKCAMAYPNLVNNGRADSVFVWGNVPAGASAYIKVRKAGDDSVFAKSSIFGVAAQSAGGANIKVVSPNGGEIYTQAQSITARFNVTNISSQGGIEVNLHDRYGASIKNLETFGTYNQTNNPLTVDRTYSLANVNPGFYKIQAKWQDLSGRNIYDETDGVFEVRSNSSNSTTFSSVVTDKNSYNIGEVVRITWVSPTGFSGANVDLLDANGAFIADIANTSGGNSPASWTIPSNIKSGSYRVRVGQIHYTDAYSLFFQVNNNVQPPTLISPNGGQTWTVGDSATISWNRGSSPSTALVKIGIMDSRVSVPAGGETIATVPNTGSYTFTIPTAFGAVRFPGANVFKIAISTAGASADSWVVNDFSTSPFSVNSPVQPTLTVTTPNGGEVWPANRSQTIRWTYVGKDPNNAVEVFLFRNDQSLCYLGNSTNSRGSFTFNPTNFRCLGSDQVVTAGTDYRVIIRSRYGESSLISGGSKNTFTISAQ